MDKRVLSWKKAMKAGIVILLAAFIVVVGAMSLDFASPDSVTDSGGSSLQNINFANAPENVATKSVEFTIDENPAPDSDPAPATDPVRYVELNPSEDFSVATERQKDEENYYYLPGNSNRPVGVSGDKYTFGGSVKGQAISADFRIDRNSNLALAINDGLIEVTLALQAVFATPVGAERCDADKEYFSCDIYYFNGETISRVLSGDSDRGKMNSLSGRVDDLAEVERTVTTSTSTNLSPLSGGGTPFIRVVMRDFDVPNNAVFNMAMTALRLGINVDFPTSSLSWKRQDVMVYDSTGMRHAEADDLYPRSISETKSEAAVLKGGDIIVLDNRIVSGNKVFDLTGANLTYNNQAGTVSFSGDSKADGRFFRRFYKGEGAINGEKNYLLTYDVNIDRLTRIETFDYIPENLSLFVADYTDEEDNVSKYDPSLTGARNENLKVGRNKDFDESVIGRYTVKDGEYYKLNENGALTFDCSGDYSGQAAAYTVVSGGSDYYTVLSGRIYRSDRADLMDTVNNNNKLLEETIYIDNMAANNPELLHSPEAQFFEKYIIHATTVSCGGKDPQNAFFTTETGDSQLLDSENRPTGVNILNRNLPIRPVMTDNSFVIRGGGSKESGDAFIGADQRIYYRATRIDDPTSIPANTSQSRGFTLEEASGIMYESIYRNGQQSDSEKELILPYRAITDDEGKVTGYEKSALYSIEFITVDFVGNYSYCRSKYYIQVDVNSYTFTNDKIIGKTDSIDDSAVTLDYATIDDGGNRTSFTRNPIFKRGDKAVIRLTFNNNAENRYVLTGFSTAASTSTVDVTRFSEAVGTSGGYPRQIILTLRDNGTPNDPGDDYTMDVSTAYSESEAARVFRFTFKNRAEIVVSNAAPAVYNGLRQGITLTVNTGSSGDTVSSGNVNVQYGYNEDGTIVYRSEEPIDAGEYPYRCYLTTHAKYYGYAEGTFRISQATPQLSNVYITSINYGDGLSKVDTIVDRMFDGDMYFNRMKASQLIMCSYNGGNYYNVSSDGVFGYFILDIADKNGTDYTRPSAGTYHYNVRFVPALAESSIGEVYDWKYRYDGDGNIMRNPNYRDAVVTGIELQVLRTSDVELTSDIGTYVYDGDPHTPTFTLIGTTPDGTEQNLFAGLNPEAYVVYRVKGATRTTSAPPTEAGTHEAVIRIYESRSNFTCPEPAGEWVVEFVIERAKLTVTGKRAEFRYMSSDMAHPEPTVESPPAGVRLTYSYTYYKYTGTDYAADESSMNLGRYATEENRVPAEEIFRANGMPINSGIYVVSVALTNANYVNSAPTYSILRILPVDNTDMSRNNRLTMSPLSLASPAGDGVNLRYLQKLGSVALLSGTQSGVRFRFREVNQAGTVQQTDRDVPGEFFLAYRTMNDGEDVAAFRAEMENYDLLTSETTSVYMYFVAADSVNFLPLYRQVAIRISGAAYNVDSVSVDSITYGDTFNETKFREILTGYPKVLWYYDESGAAVYRELRRDNEEFDGYDSAIFDYEIIIVTAQQTGQLGAGRYALQLSVNPSNRTLFEQRVFQIFLTVNKLTIYPKVIFEGETFSYYYGAHADPKWGFYFDAAGEKAVGEDEIAATNIRYVYRRDGLTDTALPLSAGNYVVEMYLDHPNFTGAAEYNLTVNKDTPKLSVMPDVSNVAALTYGRNVSEVSFAGGTMVGSNNRLTVAGAFRLLYSGAVFDRAGTVSFGWEFTPNDRDNYEILTVPYDPDGDELWQLFIAKADLSSQMAVTVNNAGSYRYGDIALDGFNIGDYVSTVVPDVLGGDVTLILAGSSGSTYLDAGTYTVVLAVSEDNENYTGRVTTSFTVGKRDATIRITQTEQEYSNGNMNIGFEVLGVLPGDNVSGYVNRAYDNITGSPSEIGTYGVTLSLDHRNYAAAAVRGEFTVRVNRSMITVRNNRQTYNNRISVTVSLGLNAVSADLIGMSYYALGEDGRVGEEYPDFPNGAGTYYIAIDVKSKTTEYTERVILGLDLAGNPIEGETRFLYIGKTTALINVQESIGTVYTGAAAAETLIRYTTEPYGKTVRKSYNHGEKDEKGALIWTPVEPLDAGVYHVRLMIDDPNYEGEIEILYVISAANPVVSEAPIFGVYYYNSEEMPSYTGGRATYNGRDLEGEFSVVADSAMYLPVGQRQRITYVFTAKKGDEIDANFNPVTMNGYIEIRQRVLTADDVTYDNKTVRYDAAQHGVIAGIRDDDDPSHYHVYDLYGINSDVRVTVQYRASAVDQWNSTPRIEPGTYNFRLVVSGRNYTGIIEPDDVFVITKGVVEMSRLPVPAEGTRFTVGKAPVLSDFDTGRALPVYSGTQRRVYGTYTVQSGAFEYANNRQVTFLFQPDNADYVEPCTFEITVFVYGIDPLEGVDEGGDWDGEITLPTDLGIEGTAQISINYDIARASGIALMALRTGSAVYGASLGDFAIAFSGDAAVLDWLRKNGTLRFVNGNDYVPEVGERVEVIFETIGDTQYNTMRGTIDLGIAKAAAEDYSTELKGFLNSPLTDAEFILRNATGNIMEGEIEFYTDSDCSTPLTEAEKGRNLTADDQGKTYYFRYVMRNYEDIVGEVKMEIVNLIAESSIVVNRTSISYLGAPLKPSDLEISFRNTGNFVIDAERDVRLTVFELDGSPAKDILEPGTYYVYIEVVNSLLYGRKTVEITITRRDISSAMELEYNTAVYNNANLTPPPVYFVLNGDRVYLDPSEYAVTYRRSGAANFGSEARYAGAYDLRVRVDSADYVGEKQFTFTITKRMLQFNANTPYSYPYSGAPGGIPSYDVQYDTGDRYSGDVIIMYYSATYSMSDVPPINAGSYTVRFSVDDDNYQLGGNGYVEYPYTITTVSVSVSEAPQFELRDGYHLTYGQRYVELIIKSGTGRAIDGGNNIVSGVFRVDSSYGETGPDAGTVSVQVRFIPDNKNYSEATYRVDGILVRPADITVSFDNLTYPYTGNVVSPEYTVSVPGVGIDLTFINSSGNETNPINAGSYILSATSRNTNYNVVGVIASDGTTAVLRITKAQVIRVVNPNTNPVRYNDSLSSSALFGGEIYYAGFENPIPGRYEFVESGRIFDFVNLNGVDVNYVFTPNDSDNFGEYHGTTKLIVEKAIAAVTAENTVFEYAGGFKFPTFNTTPSGLAVSHDIYFTEYDPNDPNYVFNPDDIYNVGTYYFSAWVDDEHYSSDPVQFSIRITKRQIDLDFVDEAGNVTNRYVTTYGKILDAKFVLYPNGTPGKRGYLYKDEYEGNTKLGALFEMTYSGTSDAGVAYSEHIPPTNTGTYTVTVSITSGNYSASGTCIYSVQAGIIEEITIDKETLENQIYGSVVEPIVTTLPVGVRYYIVYDGYENSMPTDAGNYNITVVFDDENYVSRQISAVFKINRKPLSVQNIQVSDKVYDGTPGLDITGTLFGVLAGDEVTLTMSAETVGRATNVGWHYVNITKYTLTGLQAENYDMAAPSYPGQVKIGLARVEAANSDSYISSSTGFAEGTTVEFRKVANSDYAANFFQRMVGKTTYVMEYTLKENGNEIIVNDQFKVYIAIPEEFLSGNFEVVGAGNLEGREILWEREGDYITFFATSGGQIVFIKTEMRYEFIVLVCSVAILIIGIVTLLIMNPIRSARKYSDDSYEKEVIKRIKRGY